MQTEDPEDVLPAHVEEERFSRKQACAYLATIGVRRTPATLAKLCSLGSGPPCIHDGRTPLYSKRALHEWGVRQLTEVRRSPSRTGRMQRQAAGASDQGSSGERNV